MTLPVQRSSGTPTMWRPLRGFEDIYSEFDRLVQSMVGGSGNATAWMPAADVSETDAAYVVEVELPGVRREDVDVELDGNELVVSGELKERRREGLLRRRTRRIGNFEYRVLLPGDLRTDDVEASLAYGVLTVYVPKVQATKHNRLLKWVDASIRSSETCCASSSCSAVSIEATSHGWCPTRRHARHRHGHPPHPDCCCALCCNSIPISHTASCRSAPCCLSVCCRCA